MATHQDFCERTKGMGLFDVCPVCGIVWYCCRGVCVSHERLSGRPGPFHYLYCDDCLRCQESQNGEQRCRDLPA